MFSLFCSTAFWHFSDSFIIASSQNFLSFWTKNCSRCLLQSSMELIFFPLKELCAPAKSLQSCPTLCNAIDGSPPGSPIPGILQARTLKWIAISFSNAWKWKGKVKSLSPVWLNDPMNCSLPGSSVHGIFQARVLEWCAIAFSEKNFVNTEINGYPKVQYLVNMTDESELPSQATTVFTWWSKAHAVLSYFDGRLCVFCWLILEVFHRVLLSVGLIGSSTCWNEVSGFSEIAHTRGLFQSHHVHNITFFGWRLLAFGMVGVVLLARPEISSIPHYCSVSTFHHLSEFVLKVECFHYVEVKNCMWKYGQEDFFSQLIWNPGFKVINITKLVQMVLNVWFGYFKLVGYLPHGMTLTVLQ